MRTVRQKLINVFWKSFVWLDYVTRCRKLPKTIELTERKDIVRINDVLCGFYAKDYFHGKIIEEITIEEWKHYYSINN